MFYLVYPLHVVSELLQILDIPITDLTNDKVTLSSLSLSRLTRLHHRVGAGAGGGGLLGDSSWIVSTWQWCDGDAG